MDYPALRPKAVKKLPGRGAGSPRRLAKPCEAVETARPRAVISRNFEFFQSSPSATERSTD